MSEPTTPWGALPYCQMHFVVLGNAREYVEHLVARTRKKTKGVIHKTITDVWWEGGIIADQLNRDVPLNSLLKEVLLEEGEIYIDPVENCVRIHGEWKFEYELEMSKKALEAYNTIAAHVKKFMTEVTISTQAKGN